MLLSIDPGLHAVGAAVFDTTSSNDLVWAGLIKNHVDAHPSNPSYHSMIWRGMVDAVDAEMHVLGYAPDRMAVELPQVYVASRSKGDPNDLIMLTGVVGGLVHWFTGLTFLYSPRSWKGTVDKKVMTERILKHLSEEERSKIQKAPKSLWHNVVDGIGLGLFHTKRL